MPSIGFLKKVVARASNNVLRVERVGREVLIRNL
jgi:hypothetical protein